MPSFVELNTKEKSHRMSSKAVKSVAKKIVLVDRHFLSSIENVTNKRTTKMSPYMTL
jgi:hypothetical protein